MEGLIALVKDPVKLEATIKASWSKIDAKNEGAVSLEVFQVALGQLATEMKFAELLPKTDKGKEQFKKTADPTNCGKVNFDGFKAIIQLGIKNMKLEGK